MAQGSRQNQTTGATAPKGRSQQVVETAYVPPQRTFTGVSTAGGFLDDFLDYASDAVSGGSIRRGVGALQDGDYGAAAQQAANMGNTPLGDKLIGHTEGAPTTPWHDENGDWTGPESIGNIRNGVLGAYGIPAQNAPKDGGAGGGVPGGSVGPYGFVPFDLDKGPFDNGAGDFYEAGDQAAFAFGEALNRSGDTYTPTGIRDVAPIVAPNIRDVQIGPAQMQTAAGQAPVERYTAATIDPTQLGPAASAAAAPVQRTAYDKGLALGTRDQQMADVGLVRNLAMGTGPSAAGDEFALALDSIANEQMGAVSQARGADKVALQAQAINNIGRQGMLAARERGATKAREMQAGISMLPGATSQIRAQDTAVAGAMADLDQQAALLEAQLQTAVAQGNRDAINQINTARAQLESARAIRQAELTTGASAAGAAASNDAALDWANRTDVAVRGNADRGLARDTSLAGLTLNRDIASGAQSIQAQTTTNDQGVNRDVAVDNSRRGAFDSTQGANANMLGLANSATGNLVSATAGHANAVQGQNALALDQQQGRERLSSEGYRFGAEREDKAKARADSLDAANNEMWLGVGVEGINAIRNRNKPAAGTTTTRAPVNDDDIFRS